MRGCFAELDGMILKTQLFIVLRKSFVLSIIRNGDLELITSGSQLKTMYRTYAVGVWWKLICMNSNFEDFCGHLVASQNVLAHQHQADGKLTLYRWNDSISSCFELLNRHFCRCGHKFPHFVLAGWLALVPNLALASGLVINCQIEWRFWAVGFLWMAHLKQLVRKNRASVCAGGKHFRTELVLMTAFETLAHFASPFGCPH